MIIHGEPGKSLEIVDDIGERHIFIGISQEAQRKAKRKATTSGSITIWFPAYYDFVPIVVYDIDSNFLEFEAWLQANAPSATNIAETRSTVGNNLRCYVSPDDLPLMILRWS